MDSGALGTPSTGCCSYRCCGWLRGGPTHILLGGTVAYFAMSSGQSTVFAVMKNPTRDGVGLSDVAMGTYFSVSQLLSSLLLPLAGLAVDRCGIRRTALAMVASLAVSCLAMATVVSDGFGVFLGLFAIRLFAKSAELPFKTQVNYHWQHARGRAMAVISLFGDSLGSKILVPLLLNTFTAATDWRAGYTALAVTVVLCGGVGVCLTKERESRSSRSSNSSSSSSKSLSKDVAEATVLPLQSPPRQECEAIVEAQHHGQHLSDDEEEEEAEGRRAAGEPGPLVPAPAAAAASAHRCVFAC